ncbi:MAG: hypothetical protein FWD09_00085 [Lentimicrobiaceae bacterium]|nr:hypothetical protein [Lentimicrobiaceae bacterium]
MKKLYLLLTAIILLCLPCNEITAQAPYKTSVGGMLPYGSTGTGPSFKTFLKDNFSLQTDLLWRVTLGGYIDEHIIYLALYPAVELNCNVMYQKKIKDKKNSELFWFIGGGASLGCEVLGPNGKFGANAILGLEFVFKNSPIALQIDLRPGYGMLFNSGDNLNDYFFIPDTNPWSHFDWLIGFTLRRTFNKKTVNLTQ